MCRVAGRSSERPSAVCVCTEEGLDHYPCKVPRTNLLLLYTMCCDGQVYMDAWNTVNVYGKITSLFLASFQFFQVQLWSSVRVKEREKLKTTAGKPTQKWSIRSAPNTTFITTGTLIYLPMAWMQKALPKTNNPLNSSSHHEWPYKINKKFGIKITIKPGLRFALWAASFIFVLFLAKVIWTWVASRIVTDKVRSYNLQLLTEFSGYYWADGVHLPGRRPQVFFCFWQRLDSNFFPIQVCLWR